MIYTSPPLQAMLFFLPLLNCVQFLTSSLLPCFVGEEAAAVRGELGGGCRPGHGVWALVVMTWERYKIEKKLLN